MRDYKLVPKSIVDELAQFIRQVDGNNKMGAGSLADKICERFRVDVQGEPEGWRTARERKDWPRIGEKYLIRIGPDLVMQHEVFEFDQGDDGNGGGEFFWGRDDIDECPTFDSENDEWLPLSALLTATPTAPVVQGEPVAWSGWGCQYPGKMPRLYGERRTAELNCDWENGDQVLHFTAAPQPTEQVERWRHDSEDLEALHNNLDDAGTPRHDSSGIEYSAWGRVIQYAKAAAQQPTEQQPTADDSLTPVPDEAFAAGFSVWWEQHGQFCRGGGGDYERTFAFEAWRHLYPRLMKLQKATAEQQPVVSELVAWATLLYNTAYHAGHHDTVEGVYTHVYPQDMDSYHEDVVQEWLADNPQPAPEVAMLVEALESLIKGYVGLLEAGMDRITSLGGDCDPVPVMEQSDPWLRDARAALAAYRNQEGEPDK